jgi:retinol dehydrogenase-14
MSLEGTTCIVTGGSQGLGLQTAIGLARQCAEVVVVSREPERANRARATIVRESGNDRVASLQAELSSQDAVRALAKRLREWPGRLGVLINNAAVATPVRQLTVDGLELQFAVNHLAPFLLTNLLLDRLAADSPTRVLTVASRTHASGTLAFDDLQGELEYSGPRAYNQSKLANVMFTLELARRMRGTGVAANCLHPGVAPTSLNNFLGGSGAQSTPGLVARVTHALRWRTERLLGRARVGTPEEASRASVYLASSPAVEGTTGKYFVGCREAPSSPESLDPARARRLWDVSARLTGLSEGGAEAQAAEELR